MTNEHASLGKYTSHTLFSKGLRKGWYLLCVRGELETEQTATYWPRVPLTIAALLPHPAGLLNRGPEGPSRLSGAGSHYGILSLTATGTRTLTATRTELCLPRTPTNSSRQLCNQVLLPVGVCTEFNHVHRSRWYPDIFDRMHLLFTQVHLLIDSSVEGQYVTVLFIYLIGYLIFFCDLKKLDHQLTAIFFEKNLRFIRGLTFTF